ncbi:MAG: NADH-quinone oxidoreductase subunit A [candidate division WOR-3 bacterium]
MENFWINLTSLGIFFLLGFLAIAGMLVIYKILRPRAIPEPQKYEPYESGEKPMDEARKRYFIRYFPIALMFLLFDVEIAFFLPWIVSYTSVAPILSFWAVVVFVSILMGGWMYAYRYKGLDWF